MTGASGPSGATPTSPDTGCGGVYIGGAHLPARPDAADLQAVAVDSAEVVDRVLGRTVIADRFTDAAALPTQAARDLGAPATSRAAAA